MPAGRPPIYDPKILDEIREYALGYEDKNDAVPSIVGFCLKYNYPRPSVQKWKREHPELKEMLEMLKDCQHHALINKGLSGKYNAAITALMLANHGYAKKKEVEQTNRNIDMNELTGLSDEELRDIARGKS